MPDFDYVKPDTLDKAFSLLQEHETAVLLAGGTDLLLGLKHDQIRPSYVIDLKGIPRVDSFERGTAWRFGALTKVRDLEVSPVLREKLPVLSQAAGWLGSVQIRNKATIGGNLCNASPAGDLATMFLALEAQLKVYTANGEKNLAITDFFVGPNRTALGRGEILGEIIVPLEMELYQGAYTKFGQRKAMEIGLVNAAVLLKQETDPGVCHDIKISLGAVAPTPIRALQAEAILKGQRLTAELIDQAADVAAQETKPISDFRASADYRRELVRTLVARNIRMLAEIDEAR